MATERQHAANRNNATHSTGPRTALGKRRSRKNAMKHGLTADSVIGDLEDLSEYSRFEAGLIAQYAPCTVVEQHLVSRLASLFWRLRRATLIETGLFEMQNRRGRGRSIEVVPTDQAASLDIFYRMLDRGQNLAGSGAPETLNSPIQGSRDRNFEIASIFLRLCNLNEPAVRCLGRYETALWRQAYQILALIDFRCGTHKYLSR